MASDAKDYISSEKVQVNFFLSVLEVKKGTLSNSVTVLHQRQKRLFPYYLRRSMFPEFNNCNGNSHTLFSLPLPVTDVGVYTLKYDPFHFFGSCHYTSDSVSLKGHPKMYPVPEMDTVHMITMYLRPGTNILTDIL